MEKTTRIAIVDDETASIEMLTSILETLLPPGGGEIVPFTDPARALERLLAEPVDVLFLDIEMPVLSGLDLAKRLFERGVTPKIIFITAYPQYALEAWNLEAVDYILKPYDPKQIEKALQRYLLFSGEAPARARSKPYIRCFPDFDVFIDHKPIKFQNKKSRELLALLVHHRGSWIGIDQISFELLEETPESTAKNYVRTIHSRLRRTLAQNGISDLLESKYGEIRINPAAFDCDYYDYLNGRPVTYRGRYMSDYSWAQEEAAYLLQDTGKGPRP